METIWTSYGAFGVVLIGWLIQMKGDLLLRHKVIATLVIAFVCFYFWSRHFSVLNETIALYNDLLIKVEGKENKIQNILSAFSAWGNMGPSYPWVPHVILFMFFSILIWVEKLWGSKPPLNKSIQPTANASADLGS